MKKIGTFLFSFIPYLLSIGIQYIALFYLMLVSALFIFRIAPAITGRYTSETDLNALWADQNFNSIIMIAFSVSCIVIYGIWYYKSCGGNFRVNIKKTFHPLQIIGTIIMIPGTQFATSLLVGIISMIFPSWLAAYQELMNSVGMNEAEIPLFVMIYSVCIAPIGEELIFRGVTMRIARRAFPFWFANLLQAVLFGVFHGNMMQGCYAFALGLVLGYICERGGHIYHAILFHFLFNLWGTTSSLWIERVNESLLGYIILLSTFVVLPLGFSIFNRGIQKKNN